ncbi:uncharacterized protein LOC134804597 [Cydia splendana]|uniref:uncharacterized protein LOC134804597 n=1 Tax=Cydia splendana TaxID=1100963 RepID=UPI00300D77C6
MQLKMKQSLSKLFLLVCLSIARNCGMMIRNNALMTKMVSDFHAPKAHTVKIMRNVLCKHFPTIPCELITKDNALRNLVQLAIRLLNEKQRNLLNVTTSTTTTEEPTKFPVVNSDELSQYLAVENTGYFTENNERRINTPKTAWSKNVDEGAQRKGVFPSRKAIKKYFPHKIKYKDRNEISEIDKSREKMSNSEELPRLDIEKYDHFNYKKPSNMPMWQIDYTKHGDPKINFSQESDQLRGKLVKTGSDTENTVLDTSTGRPAVQLFTELFKQKGDSWVSWHNTVTTGDGRIQFPFTKDSMSAGTYKLKFNVGDYYTRNEKETLYPYVEIVFEVKENEHYHIPLLLSPYGYSTYRGS